MAWFMRLQLKIPPILSRIRQFTLCTHQGTFEKQPPTFYFQLHILVLVLHLYRKQLRYRKQLQYRKQLRHKNNSDTESNFAIESNSDTERSRTKDYEVTEIWKNP